MGGGGATYSLIEADVSADVGGVRASTLTGRHVLELCVLTEPSPPPVHMRSEEDKPQHVTTAMCPLRLRLDRYPKPSWRACLRRGALAVGEAWEQVPHGALLGNFRTFYYFEHSSNLFKIPPDFTQRVL